MAAALAKPCRNLGPFSVFSPANRRILFNNNDWHAGNPPDPRARQVALRLGGIDIGGLRARQGMVVAPDDVQAKNAKVASELTLMDASDLK